MIKRAFVCLLATPGSDTLQGLAVVAENREAATAEGIEAAKAEAPEATVVGTLMQEDVTKLGMLLAAARATLTPGAGADGEIQA